MLQAILAQMKQQFKAAGLESPELDARLLVQEVTKLKYEELLLNNNRLMNDFECNTLAKMAHRRLQREPVSRIVKKRCFWKSEFKISPETLDPRADSETLIETVLKYTHKDPITILDLGTGTGCLLLSLLQELPQAMGIGVDISAEAIQTAQHNALNLHLCARASFVTADWAAMVIDKPFNIVISNPPYIPDADIPGLEPEVSRYDPYRALAGGRDGLDCYRTIIKGLPRFLAKQGKVFLEIGYDQAESVKGMLAGHGFNVLQVAQDLAGRNRCIVAEGANLDPDNINRSKERTI